MSEEILRQQLEYARKYITELQDRLESQEVVCDALEDLAFCRGYFEARREMGEQYRADYEDGLSARREIALKTIVAMKKRRSL